MACRSTSCSVSHMSQRKNKSQAAREMGISRRTIIRWAKAGVISEDEQGRVLLSELKKQLEAPITGENHWTGAQWSYARTKARSTGEKAAKRLFAAYNSGDPLWILLEFADFVGIGDTNRNRKSDSNPDVHNRTI